MGSIAILPQDQKQPLCLDNDALPDFYMQDFSVLGLRVDKFNHALKILEENQFRVSRRSNLSRIAIAGRAQLHQIVVLLQQHGIDCGLADIVDQVYQG